MPLNEFGLIEKYFSRIGAGSDSEVLGVGDDAAVLQLPPGEQLVTSVDTLVSGVHFPGDAAPGDIASRLLRVNLSDMAAMGASPHWFTLALTLPQANADWLQAFSASLAADAEGFRCSLVGGDTTAGNLTLSLTMLGTVPTGEALLRSGARPGDSIYVTGSLGDGAAALALIKGATENSPEQREYLLNRFYRPLPRLAEGLRLRGIASAAIDISDGLLADLGHIAEASGVGAELIAGNIPISPPVAGSDREQALQWALTGGDDYELCFTVSEGNAGIVEAMIGLGELDATRIGRIIEGSGVVCLDKNGRKLIIDGAGYQHF